MLSLLLIKLQSKPMAMFDTGIKWRDKSYPLIPPLYPLPNIAYEMHYIFSNCSGGSPKAWHFDLLSRNLKKGRSAQKKFLFI